MNQTSVWDANISRFIKTRHPEAIVRLTATKPRPVPNTLEQEIVDNWPQLAVGSRFDWMTLIRLAAGSVAFPVSLYASHLYGKYAWEAHYYPCEDVKVAPESKTTTQDVIILSAFGLVAYTLYYVVTRPRAKTFAVMET